MHELTSKVQSLSDTVETLKKSQEACNCSDLETKIRDNSIGIASNEFVIERHRVRINENEANFEVINFFSIRKSCFNKTLFRA